MRKKRKTGICILTGILVLLLMAAFMVAKIGYDMAFGRAGPKAAELAGETGEPRNTLYLRYQDVDSNAYPRQPVEFFSGGNKLRGYLYGEEDNMGIVVISHGLGAGGDSYFAETLFFLQKGWRVFAFDNTGSYKSEGDNTRGIAQSLLDLDAALDYLQQELNPTGVPVLLYGHSWGGYAAAAVLPWHPEVKAAVSMAGFASPKAALLDYAENKTGPFGVLAFLFFWGYHCSLFGEHGNISAVEGINASGTPVMVVHGTGDETLRFDGCSILSQRGQITNNRVEYIVRDAPGQNGHSNLMFSAKANHYAEKKTEEWSKLTAQYGKEVPVGVAEEFYAAVDKAQSSELDSVLFERIHRFYTDAVGFV